MYILYWVHIGILLPNIVWWLWSRMGVIVLTLIFAMLDNEKSIKDDKKNKFIYNDYESLG